MGKTEPTKYGSGFRVMRLCGDNKRFKGITPRMDHQMDKKWTMRWKLGFCSGLQGFGFGRYMGVDLKVLRGSFIIDR